MCLILKHLFLSNLIQVTITKDKTKSEKGAASEGQGTTKKVVRKVKKVNATSSGAEEEKAVKPAKTSLETAAGNDEVSKSGTLPTDDIPDSTYNSPEATDVKTEQADSTSKLDNKVTSLRSRKALWRCLQKVWMRWPKGTRTKKKKLLEALTIELMLHPPELSKWERDDYDWDTSNDKHPSRKRKLVPEKKITMLPRSVLNRAETYMAKKPVKPTVAAATSASPVRPQRRVYLEDKQDQGSEEKEERRVKTTRTSSLDMQITITKSEKHSPEQQDRASKQDRRSHEDTRTVKKSKEADEDRGHYKKRYSDERHHLTENRSRRDSSSPRRERDRRHHDREESRRHSRDRDEQRDRGESHRERDHHRDERHRGRDTQHRERDYRKDREEQKTERKTSTSEKSSTSSAPKDLRHKLEQARSKDVPKKSQRTVDRKESVIDEAKFEPDYEELEESSGSGSEEVIADQHSTVSTEETSDLEASPSKKARTDSGDEGSKKKHKKASKHKKNKKRKKSKKQKKEKKHKKEKEGKETE